MARTRRSTFDPFSVGVWTGLDNEGALACVNWPRSPSPTDPPIPAGATYPNVPTLILNGDLDNITPLEDAQQVASNFPDSKLVVIQNVNHVQALGDQYDCASRIYTRFVKSLHTGNTSCASHTAPVRVVKRFPLGALPGRPGDGRHRRRHHGQPAPGGRCRCRRPHPM